MPKPSSKAEKAVAGKKGTKTQEEELVPEETE